MSADEGVGASGGVGGVGGDGEEAERRRRWRLVLGRAAEPALGGLGPGDARLERTLDFLHGRDPDGTGAGSGSTEGSGLMTTTEWINAVHELFPRSVADRMVTEAIERHGIEDAVTDPVFLERVTPSPALLTAVLATRHLMDERVLALARRVVATVVAEMMEALAAPVRTPFRGARDPRRRTRHQVAANFDPRATVRANLKHVDPASGRLVIREPLFATRVRRAADRWQVVVAVDQSGSMGESVIHSAVTAAIFHQVGELSTHLVAFDTEVVDLTADVADPVEVLLRVQLGGGTDIDRALRYCESLVSAPRRAVVVVISDFVEGGDPSGMLGTVQRLTAAGVTVLALAALDAGGRSTVPPSTGAALARRGAHVAAMTPDRLAAWVAEVVAGTRPSGAAEPTGPSGPYGGGDR
ncbi:VWA domain-containing protein [Nocardioides sp. CPCC 205120]|uniref:VWA domain-containing protein n=1 Tax=Nocardioides sp. CPCC 205120 TaxID=3406462 RepID=UPI003B507DDA